MNASSPHPAASSVQGAGPPVPVVTQESLDTEAAKLTPTEVGKWQDTMSLMAWTCPGFRHLFYKLLNGRKETHGIAITRQVPVAATDARSILINPDTFFKMSLKERVFVVGHEIIHNVYGDVEFLHGCAKSGTVPMDDGTRIPFRNETMQKAMDYRINALLRDSHIGTVPKDCLIDDTIAKANDGVCDVYRKVYEDEETGGRKTGAHQGFDIVLKPGQSNGTPNTPRNQQQWQVTIAAAQQLEAARAQGRGHGSMDRFFKQILEPVVPWTDHIRGIFNRKVGSGSWNWKKPDRRFIVNDIYLPSRSGNGAGWIVCWGDTSGSIREEEMCRYMAELGSIIEDVQPKRITVLWCDDEIHKIDEIEEASDLETIKHAGTQGGGGGTSVFPVFDWIAEHTEAPEVFIGFTDGHVSFPHNTPEYLCIWAMTTGMNAPFGEIVRINPEK